MKTWQIVTVMPMSLIVIIGGIVLFAILMGNEEGGEDNEDEGIQQVAEYVNSVISPIQ